MQISVPVTDYIPASLLTTPGDIVIRGALANVREPGMLKAIGSHIGNTTRNSAGTQIVAGVGFEPDVVIFFANDQVSGNVSICWGFSNLDVNLCVALINDASEQMFSNNSCITVWRAAGNYIKANITSMDADGFTLEWTINGAVNAEILYLCLP